MRGRAVTMDGQARFERVDIKGSTIGGRETV